MIAVDLPGHGGTDHLPRGCEYMAGSGVVLNSVLDTLGVNYVGIIAHSMGARIACEMASRAPNRVVVVILVDSVTGAASDRPGLGPSDAQCQASVTVVRAAGGEGWTGPGLSSGVGVADTRSRVRSAR